MWHDPSLLIVGEPCKGKSNTAHTSDNFIFITQGQKHGNRIFSNDNLHARRNIFPSSFPFFFLLLLFFFFACSIHDVGERNYKLLPKFIHSLLLTLPFLSLLLLWLLFSLPFPPFFLPLSPLSLFSLLYLSYFYFFIWIPSFLFFSLLFPPHL